MTYININLFMISLFGSYYTINNYINNSSQLSLPILEKELLGKVIEFKSSYFDLNNKCFKNVIPVKFRYDKNIYDCYYSSESLRRWSAIQWRIEMSSDINSGITIHVHKETIKYSKEEIEKINREKLKKDKENLKKISKQNNN